MAVELYEEHAEVVEAADAFIAALKRTPRLGLDELTRLRVRLSSLIRQHRVTEEKFIYGPLSDRGIALPPHLEPLLQDLREQKLLYSEHIRQWTPQEIGRDWAGYVVACEERIAILKRLIRDEEATLYQTAFALIGSPSNDWGTRLSA